MRKFTTLAMALAVGSFAANAALSEPTITPANGTTMYAWTQNIVLEWDGILEKGNNLPVLVSRNQGAPQEITAELTVMGDWNDDMTEYIPTGPTLLTIDWDSIGLVDWVPQPGTYDFTIPAGLVKDSEGNESEAYELSYALYPVKGWQTVEPDPNDNMDWDTWQALPFMASELSEVKIGFDYELEAIADAPAVTVTLMSNDDEGGDIMPWAAAIDEDNVLNPELIKVEGNYIIVDLSSLTNGEWYLEIPAGYAKIKELDDTYTNSVELTYYVKNDLGAAEVVGGLENYGLYTSVNAPSYALLTWDYENIELTGEGEIEVEIYDSMTYESEYVTLPASALILRSISTGEGGGPNQDIPRGDEPVYPGDDDNFLTRADAEVFNALEIVLGEDLEGKTGGFTITIPAGLVTNGKMTNPAFEIKYDVQPVYEGEALFILDEGNLTIFWPDTHPGVAWDADPAYITDSNGNVRELYYAMPWDDDPDTEITEKLGEDWDFIGLEVYLEKLDLEDGNYTLWLPLGYVELWSEDYSAFWLSNVVDWTFKVTDGVIYGESTAIEAIAPAKAVVNGVYNLQGVKVAEGVEGLSNLAKGIYIINGKKVLVK